MEGIPKSWTKQWQEEEEETRNEDVEEKSWRRRVKSRTLAWLTGWVARSFTRQMKVKIGVQRVSSDFKYSFQDTCETSVDNVQEDTWGVSSKESSGLMIMICSLPPTCKRQWNPQWWRVPAEMVDTGRKQRARQITSLLFSYLQMGYNDNHRAYIVSLGVSGGGKICMTRVKTLQNLINSRYYYCNKDNLKT